MKIRRGFLPVLTTEDVKAMVLFVMQESWGERPETSVPAWEAFLAKRDREMLNLVIRHGPDEALEWLGRSQPTETGN
jgi:hypothetical protein